jgi:hypothetical protein
MINKNKLIIIFLFFMNIYFINAKEIDFSWSLAKIYNGVETSEGRDACFEFSISLLHFTLDSSIGFGLDINPIKYWNWGLGQYQMISFENVTLYYNFYKHNDEEERYQRILGPFLSINWFNLYEKRLNANNIIFNCGFLLSFFVNPGQFVYNMIGIEIGYKNNMGKHGFYFVFQITDPSIIPAGLIYLIFPENNKYL